MHLALSALGLGSFSFLFFFSFSFLFSCFHLFFLRNVSFDSVLNICVHHFPPFPFPFYCSIKAMMISIQDTVWPQMIIKMLLTLADIFIMLVCCSLILNVLWGYASIFISMIFICFWCLFLFSFLLRYILLLIQLNFALLSDPFSSGWKWSADSERISRAKMGPLTVTWLWASYPLPFIYKKET